MALQPAEIDGIWSGPGMWQDPDWDGQSAATFAVIIGCSAYRHLDNGTAPATGTEDWLKEARKLGQLWVSALTARRVFDWMRDLYRLTEAPLARCWLLTAPTSDEEAELPGVSENWLEPTLADCARAIKSWAATPGALPSQAQAQSRMVLFFSGHGIESLMEEHLLLPSDYLAPPMPSFDHAISMRNIRQGLLAVPAAERYFYLDACRNDADEIRKVGPKGTPILPVYPSSATYSQITFEGTLNATTATRKAWQPTKPEEGETIFGRALLDGLLGTPDIDITQVDGQDAIQFTGLVPYVKGRVPALIRSHGSTVQQTVTPALRFGMDSVVTEVDPAHVPATEPEIEEEGAVGAGTLSEQVATEALDMVEMQAGGWARDFGVGHRLFGHESVTAMFSESLRVSALTAGNLLPPDSVRLVRVARRESIGAEEGSTASYQLHLEIEAKDPIGFWLQLADEAGRVAGLPLPDDPVQRPVFVVGVTVDFARRARIDSLSALPWYGTRDGTMTHALRLWQASRSASFHAWLAQVLRDRDTLELEILLPNGGASPLALTIAAIVMLRENRLDILPDWQERPVFRRAKSSDLQVLMAEGTWRQAPGTREAVAAVKLMLSNLEREPLPMTADGLSYALGLVSQLAEEAEDTFGYAEAPLARIAERLDTVARHVRPGGLFASYIGRDDPAELLQTWFRPRG